MTRVLLQDTAENSLRALPVVGHEGSRRFLNLGSQGIGEPRTFEGHTRVSVLLEIDEDIAVGEPCEMVMRRFLQHPPYFLSSLRGTSITPIGARQIHPCGFKIRDTAENHLESRDALGDFVLIQQGSTQEP